MTRRSIDVQGLGHGGAPIPQASLIGPLLISGGISGMDPSTGGIVGGLDAQAAQIFENIGLIVAAAGGTTDDIVKVSFFARDRSVRSIIDEHWKRVFPDPDSRPARHLTIADIPSAMDIQCEIVAFLQGTVR